MAIRDNAAVKRLHKHLDFLSQLCKAKTKQRRAQLLTIATPEQIHTICESINNVLSGSIPSHIPKSKKKYLKRFKPVFVTLLKKNKLVPFHRKKTILVQKGGFLPALLAPVLGIAASLIGNLLH